VIVDSSALIAISRGEPEAAACFQALHGSRRRRISAANLLEAAIVVDGWRDPEASRDFDALVAGFAVVIEPVTREHVRIAREAYQRYGKGSRHPAKLNFGDCFAYALTKDLDEPLLFIGNDFVHTDIRPALS
jgi:ribonuclease VapC